MTYDVKLVQNFRKHLTQLGYGKGSCYMLPECVKEFLAWQVITDPGTVTREHIGNFYKWLQIRPHKRLGGGLSESYIHHHVYALKLFFGYLEETGQIRHNPISAMKFKRPDNNSREPLTKEETARLFESAQTLKETAILHLFYSCGLRRSEAEALDTRDIHFKSCLLYVREGKGAKRRAIPMTPKVSAELERYYLLERCDNKHPVHDTEAFMLNQLGKRLSGSGYNIILKEIVKRSGINRPCTLHHLRHSIATHLLENGLGIEQVRDFLGHSHLESTQIYAKVNKQKLKAL